MIRSVRWWWLLCALMVFHGCSGELTDGVLSDIARDYHDLSRSPDILLKRQMDEDRVVIGIYVDKKLSDYTSESEFSFGIVSDELRKFTEVGRLLDSDTKFVVGSNRGLSVARVQDGKIVGARDEFSIIYGWLRAPGYRAVEVSWNCNQSEVIDLSPGGLFFTWKPNHGLRRCNDVYVHTVSGERLLLARDPKTQRYQLPGGEG